LRRRAVAIAVATALATITVVMRAGDAAPNKDSFARRGVIEGMYGPPWSHPDRIRILRFEIAHHWNTYVHAPKNDPYQRLQWRLPYSDEAQRVFDAEIRFARSKGIAWVPNVSPGKSLFVNFGPVPSGPLSEPLCFSCTADFDLVVTKLERFQRAGARVFMVSLDDAGTSFTHPEDAAKYGDGTAAMARATADFLTHVHDELRRRDATARLWTVLPDYSGPGTDEYTHAIAPVLPGDIEVMWTGPAILSTDFTAADAAAYGRAIGRKPLLWDNWTATDTRGGANDDPTVAFFGPYARSHDLSSAVGGILLNPTNRAELNLVGFGSAARYFDDPRPFDARRSFLAAVAELTTKSRDALRAFAETSYLTSLDTNHPDAIDAPTFVERNHRFLTAYAAGGNWRAAAAALRRELTLVIDARRSLAADKRLARFIEQAQPFLESARRAAEAGRAGLDLLLAERAPSPDPSQVQARRIAFETAVAAITAAPQQSYGDRARRDVATPNVMDAWIAEVRTLDAKSQASQ